MESDPAQVGGALGVHWYAGCPTAGKSTLALRHLADDIRANGCPALIIDAQRVWNFKEVPHVSNVHDAIVALYQDHRHVAISIDDPEQMDRLAKGLRCGKDINILIDEARYWLSAHQISRELSLLMRTSHQHSRCIIRCTTQRLEDIHQDALACTNEMYVFRCTSPRTLERLEREFGIDISKVKSLERGQFISWKAGF